MIIEGYSSRLQRSTSPVEHSKILQSNISGDQSIVLGSQNWMIFLASDDQKTRLFQGNNLSSEPKYRKLLYLNINQVFLIQNPFEEFQVHPNITGHIKVNHASIISPTHFHAFQVQTCSSSRAKSQRKTMKLHFEA